MARLILICWSTTYKHLTRAGALTGFDFALDGGKDVVEQHRLHGVIDGHLHPALAGPREVWTQNTLDVRQTALPTSWTTDARQLTGKSHAQIHKTHNSDSVIEEWKGRGWPEQFGGDVGADWLSRDDWQAGGLGGRKLSVVKGGKSRCERVPGAQMHLR